MTLWRIRKVDGYCPLWWCFFFSDLLVSAIHSTMNVYSSLQQPAQSQTHSYSNMVSVVVVNPILVVAVIVAVPPYESLSGYSGTKTDISGQKKGMRWNRDDGCVTDIPGFNCVIPREEETRGRGGHDCEANVDAASAKKVTARYQITMSKGLVVHDIVFDLSGCVNHRLYDSF
jgi:hypothetical protein